RDLLRNEVRERRAERLALAQDRDPGEAGLEALEAEALVQAALVAHGAAPLLVVIRHVQRVVRRPAANAVVSQRRPSPCRRRSAPGTSRRARTPGGTSAGRWRGRRPSRAAGR